MANKLSVIILADNIPKAYKNIGPRCLLIVDNKKTLLEYQIETILSIKKYSEIKIFIVTGFENNKIKNVVSNRSNVTLVYNPLFITNSTCTSVAIALDGVRNDDIIVMNDCVFYDKNIIRNLCNDKSALLVNKKRKTTINKVGIIHENNIVTNMAYSLPNKWEKVAFFTKKESRSFKDIIFNYELSSNWLIHEAILYTITNNKCKYNAHFTNKVIDCGDVYNEHFSSRRIK